MSFWACIYIWLNKIFIFFAKTFNFDQIYLNTVSKNQNVEELSLDLIFQSKVFVNKLRLYSKPDRNQSKLSVWTSRKSNLKQYLHLQQFSEWNYHFFDQCVKCYWLWWTKCPTVTDVEFMVHFSKQKIVSYLKNKIKNKIIYI